MRRTDLYALLVVLVVMMASMTVVTAPPAAAATGDILPPFSVGETWNICQGYSNPSITHTGTSTYGVDLTGAGCDNSASGRTARAPMDGTVAYYQASYGNLCINTANGGSYTLTHINSTATSGIVSAGQAVGTVAAPGSRGNNGVAHIHFQVWSTPNCYSSSGIPLDTAHGTRICGAPDMTASGPNGGNGTWSGTALLGLSCSEPDGDSDNVSDVQDWCPQVAGLAINYGCPRPNSQSMSGDFNKDGRADIAAFFDYDGGNVALHTWAGQPNGALSPPDKEWQAGSGWDGTRLIPIGVADFDGDTNQDVASFFNYGNGELGLFVWYGDGSGNLVQPIRAWHAASGWDGARVIPAGIADFNKDGRSDVAAFFNYGGTQTALFTWDGQGNRSLTAPLKRWEAISGWDARRLKAGVAGDFNGDGNQDVTAFFDYGDTAMGAFVWSGDGTGGLSLMPRSWFTASGWSGTRIIPAGAADINQDGRSDIAIFFDYGGGNSALFTWNGRLDSLFDAPVKRWQATSGWEGSRIMPFGVADFNGDGSQDVSTFFNYGGTSTGAFVWNGSGVGSLSLTPRSWFASSGWASNRIIPNR